MSISKFSFREFWHVIKHMAKKKKKTDVQNTLTLLRAERGYHSCLVIGRFCNVTSARILAVLPNGFRLFTHPLENDNITIVP
jgi:hypothetical protein